MPTDCPRIPCCGRNVIGRPDAIQSEEIERHLDECPPCADTVAAISIRPTTR